MGGVDAIEVAHRGLGDHQIGSDDPDEPGDRPTQVEIGDDGSVGEAQPMELGHPDDPSRIGLFGPADLSELGAGEVRRLTGVAVGDQSIDDIDAVIDQRAGGAGRSEVDVVGMSDDDQGFRGNEIVVAMDQFCQCSRHGRHRRLPVAMETTSTGKPEELNTILTADDVTAALWSAIDGGRMVELVPELLDLRMEQDPIHRHKEVLSHTVAVVAKTPDDVTVRLAALFHDIAKPQTRSYDHGGVTFRHHEVVGARMTRKRMEALGYDAAMVDDVSELVRLSGRFKGYTDGWSDTAVRRYARDAGHLLGRLNALVRSDCTTRNKEKVAALQVAIDELEHRIATLAEQERVAAERPQLDGDAVMTHLGVGPGRHIGDALVWLLALKRTEGELPADEINRRLDAWWIDYRT